MVLELTFENVRVLKLGDVVKLNIPEKIAHGMPHLVGVVYASSNEYGIMCHREGEADFTIGAAKYGKGIEFEVLTEHSPVKQYEKGYDFVSNHQNDEQDSDVNVEQNDGQNVKQDNGGKQQ